MRKRRSGNDQGLSFPGMNSRLASVMYFHHFRYVNTALSLPDMTRSEKLRTMEELWDDLCHSAEEFPSPSWHGEVLAERTKRVEDGKAEFRPWDAVKARLLGHQA